MRTILTILLIALISVSWSQTDTDYSAVDKMAGQLPDSMTHTVSGLAKYIGSRFKSQPDRARALFAWIAKNISYDIEKRAGTNFYQDKKEVIQYVLKNRRGVFLHYSQLFAETANLLGIKTYVITGYTKQNGSVNFLAHAWCAAQIDLKWYLFDPTWGAGYLQESKFVKHLNDEYFMVPPGKMIGTHMPFDPLWQFLEHPVSNKDFSEGTINLEKSGPLFSFPDSLKRYEESSSIEKLESTYRRTRQNGVINALISDKLEHTKEEIEFYYASRNVDRFNAAVKSYNEGVTRMNRFIDYRNRQFTPAKPDDEIKKMLAGVDKLFTDATKELDSVSNPDPATASNISQLKESIGESVQNLNEQNAFLEKYLRTGKAFRKTLFYKTRIIKAPAK